jgi:NADPH2:quinone reductase
LANEKTVRSTMVDADRRLVVTEAPAPVAGRSQALIDVFATSLNRGEVHRARVKAEPGFRPGWDFSGVVSEAAPDGSGPPAGARVVGVLPSSGAWSERVVADVRSLAILPQAVSFAEAACLPVAGLTALNALGRRGDLVGRRVLITGATGGVGHFGCQLAKQAGALVVAAVRSEAQRDLALSYGAHQVVVVDDEPLVLRDCGLFDVIVEPVGGRWLEAAVKVLAPQGVCVVVGVSSGRTVTFDAEEFFYSTASITGMVLFRDFERLEAAGVGLARLLNLVAAGQLKPHITVERDWSDIDAAADDLLKRAAPGKTVIRMR